MEFLSLSRRRSSARNVPSGEDRGETDVLFFFFLGAPGYGPSSAMASAMAERNHDT